MLTISRHRGYSPQCTTREAVSLDKVSAERVNPNMYISKQLRDGRDIGATPDCVRS